MEWASRPVHYIYKTLNREAKILLTMNSPLRVGIVGCGPVVREYHLPMLTTMPELQIVALCDKSAQVARLANGGFQLNALVATTICELRGKVDAVLVAVPPALHAPVSIELLNAGIDVLCEKPLAIDVREAQQMIDVANSNNRILAVGLQTRFHPNNVLLKEVVAAGWLGQIQEVNAEFGAPLDWQMAGPSYYSPATTGGGVFFDMGVHIVDRVTWLFGDLHELAYEDDSYSGFESNALLSGKLVGQGPPVACRMQFSWTHTLANSIRIIGSEATAEVKLRDRDSVFVYRQLNGRTEPLQLGNSQGTHSSKDPFLLQFQNFVNAVQTRQPPFIPAISTLRALEIIKAAYRVRRRMCQPWMEVNEYS